MALEQQLMAYLIHKLKAETETDRQTGPSVGSQSLPSMTQLLQQDHTSSAFLNSPPTRIQMEYIGL